MEMINVNCMRAYCPGSDIALDEISILMTGATEFCKITKHKKVYKSIQWFALGDSESTEGLQYLWCFILYHNNREKGKIETSVMVLVNKLEEETGYHIYMDNLFTSHKVLNEIRKLGHGACGTVHARRGMPSCVEAIKSNGNGKPNPAARAAGVNEQGDWTFSCFYPDNIVASTWFDSGICHFMSNIHPPDENTMKRRKKGVQGKKDVTCPLAAKDYNENMGAIDDIDRVLELC